MKKLWIAIDFDGTIVDSDYPTIHALKPGVVDGINYLYDKGHTIIINTCRVNKYLEEAVKYLDNNNIKYNYVNENDPIRISQYLEDARKISADVYIDDKNIFCHELSWPSIINEIDRLSN